MKNITNIIIGITAFAVINCASTATFAQKHSKKTGSNSYSSAPSRNYSNYSNYSSGNDWKFGGNFGMMFSFLNNSSGAGPTLNAFVDYAASSTIGIQANLGWERRSNSKTFSDLGSSGKLTIGLGQSSIGMGFSIRYDLSKNMFMTAGPRLHIPVGSLSITADASNGTQQKHAETTVDGVSTTAFGIEIGAGYCINVTNSMQIVPRASYQFMPSVGSDTNAGGIPLTSSAVHEFQFSVGMMTSF